MYVFFILYKVLTLKLSVLKYEIQTMNIFLMLFVLTHTWYDISFYWVLMSDLFMTKARKYINEHYTVCWKRW